MSASAPQEEKRTAPPPQAYGYGYGYAQAAPAEAPPTGAAATPAEPAAVAAPPVGNMVTIVEDFNRILKKMTCELVVRHPTDATIDRAKKRILMAMDMDPILIIDAVGPYLYKFKDGIYAGDADFFIENDYDAEIKQSVNAEKADLTLYIIPKVKTAWLESGPDEREAYKETVQALLDTYLDYLAIVMAKGQ